MGLLDAPPPPAARYRIDIDRPAYGGTARVAPMGGDPVLNAYSTGIAGALGVPSFQDSMMRLGQIRNQSGGLSRAYASALFDSPLAPGFGAMGTIDDVGRGAVRIAGMTDTKPSVTGLRDTLEAQGWRVNHTSQDGDNVRSVYLTRADDLSGKDEVRISDHELGTTVYGEPQGGHWKTNLVIQPGLSVEDHMKALMDEEYRNSFEGFVAGYSYDEWLEASQ